MSVRLTFFMMIPLTNQLFIKDRNSFTYCPHILGYDKDFFCGLPYFFILLLPKLNVFLKVEYEYTEDADLIPDFQLTELDQNDQVNTTG